MELTEHYALPVTRQRAWEALNDVSILRAAIPGCDHIEAEGGDCFALSMSLPVGPVKIRFKGRLRLTDIDAPRTYTIVFESQGASASSSKGSARVTLDEDGAATKLSYTAQAQVGGRLAQIGSRLVNGAAHKLADEFFRRFSARLIELSCADAASRSINSALDADAAKLRSRGDNQADGA